ncbi:probable ADP-ribosylation factor GTPase-activating protein AGD14 isoform X1 [Morus notabilis]|uniref:probable ADP-ribosylation factor GTPase-activating protein AGD14 isoform X1 n=1 Tax=Morus notabilis TaxID=981085 RepID=UPI000CED5938|nr:probable ADP-ribosylation factor GTPase-activating protein AGD14 isoform X1 [Morus notabilis]XP_024029806.1 probable ADP-ribosylation factor GTPase-activating protein AGD14 isoform X1 [Morus notabilis]
MANRVKEDEKNERIIRGLLKLQENRRCINCNSLGPQYVCTNFWTFVCTTCSGIHREFTHRVKSISMAKFTSQEVSALQEGGNKRAKEIYLKEWDPQRNSFPDSSNIERLRDFIKHVYVDRRFSGEKNHDKPPRAKMGEELYENRRTDSYQGGSRSPPYEDNERRYSEKSSPGGRSYDGGRSPGYDQESRQYSDYRRSPARSEIVNDWRREDRFGNGRRSEERRMSDGDLKLEGRSPERPKDPDSSSSPVVRPVREILGENTIPLRISEPPKPAARIVDASAHTQRTASSSSLGSTNGNPVEVKLEATGSLIDFDADPEPPVVAATPPQQYTVAHSTPQPANSTNDSNWASFDAFPPAKVSQAPNANPLESVLSQLTVLDPASAPVSGSSGNVATVTTTVNNLSSFPLDGVSAVAPGLAPALPVNGGNTLVNVSGATHWPTVQQQHQPQQQQPSLFPAAGNQSTAQQFIQSVTGPSSNQPWNLAPAPNAQGFPSTSMAQAPSAFPKPAHEFNSVVTSQPPASDVKLSGRNELPEDLFTLSYSAYRAPVPGWQTGPPGGMGYPMQYNPAMPIPTYQQSSKSTNPFDLNSDPPVQVPAFPSMVPLQSALPNVLNPSGLPPSGMPPSIIPTVGVPPSSMPPSGLMRTSSLGAPSSAWMPQSSAYTSVFPPHAPYGSAMPPRAYIGQQVPGNMPAFGHQGVGGGVAEGAAFGSVNTDQQLGGRFSAPTTPTPFPSGGNPFG